MQTSPPSMKTNWIFQGTRCAEKLPLHTSNPFLFLFQNPINYSKMEGIMVVKILITNSLILSTSEYWFKWKTSTLTTQINLNNTSPVLLYHTYIEHTELELLVVVLHPRFVVFYYFRVPAFIRYLLSYTQYSAFMLHYRPIECVPVNASLRLYTFAFDRTVSVDWISMGDSFTSLHTGVKCQTMSVNKVWVCIKKQFRFCAYTICFVSFSIMLKSAWFIRERDRGLINLLLKLLISVCSQDFFQN